ncbi:hypothetical protein [Inquilinus limosus]|uniref:hypothetical protein n=1 Tax=Inquilinus limosus TaxID=171674 RepID=UPI001269E14C|nr:hypothetical protein [Inquilinus limosus]
MTLFPPGPRRIAATCVTALLLLTAAAAARAALPPYWQRLEEIKAILDSNELSEKLQGHPIDRIERPGDDFYRVQAGPCSLDIRIVDDPASSTKPAMPGPRSFHIEAGKAACR